jgi:EAL domain-containing protein (putative c-di-GMP-specific phosphodiesterase class I)
MLNLPEQLHDTAAEVPAGAVDRENCVELRYRPMMTVQTQVVSTFLALPVRRTTDNNFQSGYDLLSGLHTPDDILELDQLTAGDTADELGQLVKQGGKSLFVVPVHYQTLSDKGRSQEYFSYSTERLKGLDNRVIVEIVQLPGGIEQQELSVLVASVAPMARAVLAQISCDDVQTTDLNRTGLHAIGLDIYNRGASEGDVMDEMDRFAALAANNRLKTYVEGVRTRSMFTAAVSNGFNYVSGHIIGAACRHAEDVKVFRPETLYRTVNEDSL